MKVETIEKLISKPRDFNAERLQSSEFTSGDDLRMTVVFTTLEGTKAALRTAARLAKDLGGRIRLIVPEVVPFQFPLDSAPIAVGFLERRLYEMVCASDIREGEVLIQLVLCRDRYECLRRMLPTRSLVVMGGEEHWWLAHPRKLERFLEHLGHQVIFVSSASTKPFWREWRLFLIRTFANFPAGRTEI
jgi:hypothetical protein